MKKHNTSSHAHLDKLVFDLIKCLPITLFGFFCAYGIWDQSNVYATGLSFESCSYRRYGTSCGTISGNSFMVYFARAVSLFLLLVSVSSFYSTIAEYRTKGRNSKKINSLIDKVTSEIKEPEYLSDDKYWYMIQSKKVIGIITKVTAEEQENESIHYTGEVTFNKSGKEACDLLLALHKHRARYKNTGNQYDQEYRLENNNKTPINDKSSTHQEDYNDRSILSHLYLKVVENSTNKELRVTNPAYDGKHIRWTNLVPYKKTTN